MSNRTLADLPTANPSLMRKLDELFDKDIPNLIGEVQKPQQDEVCPDESRMNVVYILERLRVPQVGIWIVFAVLCHVEDGRWCLSIFPMTNTACILF